MKTLLLIFSVLLGLSLTANADLSLECKKAHSSKGVRLDYVDGWHLQDSSESTLKKSTEIEAQDETKDSVTFLHDFGSDYAKSQYQFEGLQKCGIYDETVKVVKLTKSLRSFDGKTHGSEIQNCSCIED